MTDNTFNLYHDLKLVSPMHQEKKQFSQFCKSNVLEQSDTSDLVRTIKKLAEKSPQVSESFDNFRKSVSLYREEVYTANSLKVTSEKREASWEKAKEIVEDLREQLKKDLLDENKIVQDFNQAAEQYKTLTQEINEGDLAYSDVSALVNALIGRFNKTFKKGFELDEQLKFRKDSLDLVFLTLEQQASIEAMMIDGHCVKKQARDCLDHLSNLILLDDKNISELKDTSDFQKLEKAIDQLHQTVEDLKTQRRAMEREKAAFAQSQDPEQRFRSSEESFKEMDNIAREIGVEYEVYQSNVNSYRSLISTYRSFQLEGLNKLSKDKMLQNIEKIELSLVTSIILERSNQGGPPYSQSLNVEIQNYDPTWDNYIHNDYPHYDLLKRYSEHKKLIVHRRAVHDWDGAIAEAEAFKERFAQIAESWK